MAAPLSAEQLAALTLTDAERRSSWRYHCGSAALTRLLLPDTDERHFAWVFDVSCTGISFDLLTPLRAGQHVVFPLRDSDSQRIEHHAVVVHTTHVDRLCRVGCVFQKALSHAEMGTFLNQMRGAGKN